MTTTPALEQLLGAYLNEDWNADYATWEEAVDAFIAESSEDVDPLPGEIARILSTPSTEDEVRDYILTLGGGYDADRSDGGYRAWLTEIARRVEAATRPHD